MLKNNINTLILVISLIGLTHFCNAQNSKIPNENYADKKFSVSINAVYSYQYGLRGDYYINTSLIDLANQARNGFGYYIDAHMALNKSRSFFIGLEYANIQSYGSLNSAKLISKKTATVYEGTLDLKIRSRIIGLNFMLALAKKNPKHCVYFIFGLDQTKYNEEYNIAGKYSSGYSRNFTLNYGFKYDKRINRNWAISSGVVLNKGIIIFLENENLLEDYNSLLGGDEVDIGKLNFSVGARYYFGKKL